MTTTPLAALRQHCDSSLEPGEEFLAGIHVHAPEHERANRDVMLGVAVGSLIAFRDQLHEQRAAVIPLGGAGAYVGVTDRRILVFGTAVGLHPKELLGAVDRDGISLDSSVSRIGLVKQARFRLLDGERTVVDAACSAKSPDLESMRGLIPAAS